MGRVKRRRALERRAEAAERKLAAQRAHRAPSPAERRLTYDIMISGLRAKLERVGGNPPTGDVELTGPALELFQKFQKLSDDTQARQRAARVEFLKRSAGAWTKALRGPKQEEVEQKITPAPAKETTGGKPRGDDIASAFIEANSGSPRVHDYGDVRGSSEAEIWQEAHRRYGSD